MKVPFLDLRVSDRSERSALLSAVERVLRHGRLVMGPEVAELEKSISDICTKKFGVGVNSGTDALFLALKALAVGAGDEVITTSLSWIATANAIALTGATPVFADIGDDLNIDPESIEELITGRTKAIMPVHYTGKVCRMKDIKDIASKRGLFIIEDASQAFGARYYGRPAGSFGEMACFSMNAMKVFAACGEAGIVLTDRKDLYEKLVALRYNGTVNREECIIPSLNGRIDTIQAAILLERLKHVNDIISKRKANASIYDRLLEGIVKIPKQIEGEEDVYYTYTIRTPKRDELKSYLESCGIETKVQHPYLMPQQPAYREGVRGRFDRAKKIVKEILCIPINEKLGPKEVEYVASSIRKFFKR